MKMRKYSLPLRLIAMVLTFVFLLSAMPSLGLFAKAKAAGNAAGILKTEADPHTLNSWKDAFNPTNISTEHAGGIWTDKSVILADNIANAFGNISGLEAGENNFLVALSALAANSVVVGKSRIPTDTVFVLDISGSMTTTDLRSMVSATNDAIHTLLTSNANSRVGVILYSTTASVLLPLDRYQPVTESNGALEYIEYSDSQIRAARVSNGTQGGNRPGQGNQNYTYITNSSNRQVTTAISVGGGTYIQGGLWAALEMFQNASVSGQRAPALVLMSDGAPTFVAEDFDDVPNNSQSGDGNSSEDGEAFLTQLTAAYVKEMISREYSTGSYTAPVYLYTLGLNVSSGDTVSIAEAVLNTDKTRTGLDAYWNTYLGLANKTDKTMSVTVHTDGGWFFSYTEDVSITYNSSVTNRKYVDKYFSAANASQLGAAFQSIVGEISLKSGYYVTRLNGANANAGGFISFVDEIGTGMQVKEIEGILIGDHLYTGLQMAKALEDGSLGTAQNPTTLGDNMVWAIIERMDITASGGMTADEIARDLLSKAYAAGQLGYTSDTNWSNYIGWFGDANGNFIGFWDVANPNTTIPEGAVYANKCYGMLGATTNSQTAHASDMMYVAVQVSKPVTTVNGVRTVLSNSPERVTFSIPASLIPVITYQISVDANDNENIDENTTATISYNGAEPIRLIYEVGVHSELTPENIHSFIRPGYQAKDDDGNYYLYTNAWHWEGADWDDASTYPKKGDAVLQDTAKNAITYAYFEPGEDNEHYYFTDDSLIYVKNGNDYVPYEGAARPDGTYYYKHLTFTGTADSSDPSKAVTANVTAHFEELSEKALELSQKTSGANTWYVPAGTMHRNMHEHDRSKTTNTTRSFFAVRHQLVDVAFNGDSTHHFELLYMGNNGRVTYVPSQGFTLTKEMVEGEISGELFAFTVTVTGDTDGKVTLVTGSESKEYTLNNGVLELGLYAGETVLVTGLDTGASYTIQETLMEGYKLDAIAAGNTARIDIPSQTVRDVVEEHTIKAVTYTNAIQHYGNLQVTKEVTYLKGTRPADGNTDTFPVKVTFDGWGGKSIYVDGVKTTLAADGTYTFDIVDGKTIQFTGIPAGTTYTVAEVSVPGSVIPEGYTAEDGYTITMGNQSGSITANNTSDVTLENRYEPSDVELGYGEPDVIVNVDKTLVGSLTEWSFDFVLQHYNGSAWEDVTIGGETVKLTLDQDNTTKSFDMKGVVLSTVGNHYFRVVEVIPQEQTFGMTYDRTLHDFVVTVVDDLSGKLKIADVKSVQHAEVGAPVDGDGDGSAELWTVTTEFTNTHSVESTKLTIQANKVLYNITTGEEVRMPMKDGQFQFTLYSADANFENLTKIEDSRNGIGGQIVFTPIVYMPENASEMVYHYVVKESSAESNGYKVDNTEYKITVTVAVNTDGGSVAAKITKVLLQKNDETAVDLTELVLSSNNVLHGPSFGFKNTYQATPARVNIVGTKTLTNLTPGVINSNMTFNAGVFSFSLADASGELQAVSNTANGEFRFAELVFDEVGVYTYTIREKSSTMAGVTMDTKVYTMVVTVTDDGEGALHAHVTLNGDNVVTESVQVAFNNTYKAAPTTGIVLEGTKVLQFTGKFDRPLRSGEFRFTLTKPDGTKETVYNDASGKFSFSALSFDTVGSYTYTISEVGAGTTANGIVYASNTITVTVDVVDDGNGSLVAKVNGNAITTYHAGTFTNTYIASPVTVELTGHKYLVGGRELLANEFSFTLTKPDGTETVKNDAEGKIAFSAITFDSVGTYTFTVAEDKLDENGQPLTPDANGNYIYKGVTYSQVKYTITVTVVDNGTGNLVAHVVTEDDRGNLYPIQFFNRYHAEPVDVTLGGEKNLEDSTSITDKTAADFEFSFVLTDADKNILETVTNQGGVFAFETLTFAKPSVSVYYIYELANGIAGIVYDETCYKVTVTVTDNGIGNLEAAVAYEIVGDTAGIPAEKVVFNNGYAAEGTSVVFTGLKTFRGGRDLKAGEFSFILKNAAGELIETVTNDANGVFTFTAISYTKEGEYVYTLEELAGDDDNVTYDGTKYTLTVTVADVNGQLTATTAVTVDNEAREEYGFLNIFTPDDVSTTIVVEKIVDNKTDEIIGRDGFLFDLYCNETRKTVTLTSGIDGLANFELTFTGEDVGKTYTYKLTEQKGDMPYMSYSKKVYNISITVGQDSQTGELTLTVTRDGEAITGNATFVNTYAIPFVPETGDNAHVELFGILMGISAVCLLAVLVLNKKFLQ